MENWKHEFIFSNKIKIHYVTAGEGPLVLLLHGFPQFWYTWRHQIPALAEHYHVVAPDLRGYGDTDKPQNISDYQSHILTADVAGLINSLGYEKAHVVGHDWGGSIAWKTALEHPQVIDRLAVLNCPHPHLFAKALQSNVRQALKSWYIFFFQIPYLPEFVFKMFSKKLLEGLFRDKSIRPGTFNDEDIEKYRLALEKPGAFTAALNYYRAAFRKKVNNGQSQEKDRKIASPTLLIWGEEDTALGKELTYGMEPLFRGPFHLHYVPNCSHWVNEEQPELVNRLLLEFLS
jgi:epoxide hydrolase 4